jgi:hypothetical protein
MYHSYTGHLKRAWTTLRRAMTLGQAMGLHEHARPPLFGSGGEYQVTPRPEQLWFALVHIDRYLSLMLNLPQCSAESRFAAPLALEACTPEEQLRRLDCCSAGLLLKHREGNYEDDEATMEADRLLQDAAVRMPPNWWSHPPVSGKSGKSELHSLGDIIRIEEHLRHYHLLAQVHWSYLIRNDGCTKYEYNKLTAIQASREALARCLALQNTKSGSHHSPALNRIAFIASTAICIGFFESCRSSCNGGIYATSFPLQRAADRSMMEQALEHMEQTQSLQFDTTSSKIRDAFRKLLNLHTEANDGVSFIVKGLTRNGPLDEFDGKMIEGGLRLSLMFCNDIIIKRSELYGENLDYSSNLQFDDLVLDSALLPSNDAMATQVDGLS